MAMIKKTSIPKPPARIIPSAPLIATNTTLEQDGETVLAVWLALGGDEDRLTLEYYYEDYELCWRDVPSDNMSEWWGVTVENGRVTKIRYVGTS